MFACCSFLITVKLTALKRPPLSEFSQVCLVPQVPPPSPWKATCVSPLPHPAPPADSSLLINGLNRHREKHPSPPSLDPPEQPLQFFQYFYFIFLNFLVSAFVLLRSFPPLLLVDLGQISIGLAIWCLYSEGSSLLAWHGSTLPLTGHGVSFLIRKQSCPFR